MRAILDSGYLFALANVKDRNHERAAAVAEAQKAEDLILPTTVLTEAAYLIHSRLGHRAMREFVLGISNSPVQFQSVDDAVGEYPLSPALSPTRGERGPESLRGGSDSPSPLVGEGPGVRGSEFANSIVDKEDLLRIHQILEQYAGANLDFADASIMALAEKFDVRLLLTLDQRDFRMVRPAHCDHFDILP